jgi:MFS family permease
MTDQEVFYYVNAWQARPKPRRWWPKAITILAVLGGIYGSALGSAINTTGAAETIGLAAALMALICAVPGARFGVVFGMVNRVHFGRSFVGMFAAIGGAILGGFFGIVAVMPCGAILGAVCGWFFNRVILQQGFFKRFLGGFVGVVLGACVGATALALRRDQAAAPVGIAWGAGIGAVVGPLLFLLFIRTLNSLPRWQDREGNVIEAPVVDVSKDEDSGADP